MKRLLSFLTFLFLTANTVSADVKYFVASRLATSATGTNLSLAGYLALTSAGTAGKGLMLNASAIPSDISGAMGHPLVYSFTDTNATHKNAAFFHGSATANGPKLIMGKSRATDGSANTVVSNGDQLAIIEAWASDGANFQPAAAIYAEADAASGTTDTPGRWVFYTTTDGTASLAEAMRLTSAQNAVFAGKMTSTRTSDLGWTPVAAANQACNTTCTSACVGGINIDAGFVAAAFVDCTTATADVCQCAGAS